MTRHGFRKVSFARLSLGLVAAGALLVSSAAAGASAAVAGPSPAAGRLVVPTADGAVQGKASGMMDEFLGIPYAAPPVGPLRWRAPQPPARWHGIRQATKFGPHCPQPPSPFGVASTSQNCLYLNVFTPANTPAGQRLPVMVWLPGGAFVFGESNDYHPTGLVRHGVVVVTLNYRIGALGFLADKALAGPDGSAGNYGLMDQQAALRWVQANIARFGGDPGNVTLFGESAGGVSVLSQLASPGARGLFAKAIVESGTYDLAQQPLAAAESAGRAFAAKVGCTTDVGACLRKLPVKTIIDDEDFSGYEPDLDGQVLTQPVYTALASGEFNRVPVIIGTNRDEWRLFVGLDTVEGNPVTSSNYESMIESTLGVPASVAAVIEAKYPLSHYSSPSVALGAVGTDAIFACPAVVAERSLSTYVPTFAYEFNDRHAPQRYLPPVGFPYGAAHASELQYLFTLHNTPNPGVLSPAQRQLAAAMKQDWTNFAKSGVPARPAVWPQFTSTGHQVLSLLPPKPQVETNYSAEHHCPFWGVPGS